ncbi:MAG: hypothetical protein QOI74_1717 [Micromonosporaceae bacterium]|jgi:hypothetical protein|nr:hypothetical protein [Micromonosporaceae bacterium]
MAFLVVGRVNGAHYGRGTVRAKARPRRSVRVGGGRHAGGDLLYQSARDSTRAGGPSVTSLDTGTPGMGGGGYRAVDNPLGPVALQ